jgi:hypothetical protein
MKITKKQTTRKANEKRLKVNKKTIKDLDARKTEQVKGGVPKIPEVFSGVC